MKTYTTRAAARIGTGILALTPTQASSRLPNLRALGDGCFEILTPVEFKAGETFGFDQELPRSLVACLEESEQSIEDLEQPQLLAMAHALGLTPHPKTGKPKLLEAIKAKQDELLEVQNKGLARIAELEALGDTLTDEQEAELLSLYASSQP